MKIENIPSTYAEFAQFNSNYEQQQFIYADSNRRVGESTVNLFLSWFPAVVRPLLKPVVQGMFDDRAIAAFGFTHPHSLTRNLIAQSLKIRGFLSKIMLPRNNPDFYTDSKLRSYPHGYNIQDLGPTKMLKTLNKSGEE